MPQGKNCYQMWTYFSVPPFSLASWPFKTWLCKWAQTPFAIQLWACLWLCLTTQPLPLVQDFRNASGEKQHVEYAALHRELIFPLGPWSFNSWLPWQRLVLSKNCMAIFLWLFQFLSMESSVFKNHTIIIGNKSSQFL